MEAAPHPWPALGVLLLRDGLVEKDELEEILEEQRDSKQQRVSGRRLGEILIQRGRVTPTQVAKLVAEQYELPFVDFDVADVDVRVASIMREDDARRFWAIPINRGGDGTFLLAIADPSTVLFSDELRRILGSVPRFAVVGPDAMERAISFVYSQPLPAISFASEPTESADDLIVVPTDDAPHDEAQVSHLHSVAPERSWPPLGALLLRDGLVTNDDLETALAQQRLAPSLRLGEILTGKGLVSRGAIARLVAEQYELPFYELERVEIDPEVARLLPEELAWKRTALPIARHEDGSLDVAIADPTNAVYTDDLHHALDVPLAFVVASPHDIETALDRLYEPAFDPLTAHADSDDVLEPFADATGGDVLEVGEPPHLVVEAGGAEVLDAPVEEDEPSWTTRLQLVDETASDEVPEHVEHDVEELPWAPVTEIGFREETDTGAEVVELVRPDEPEAEDTRAEEAGGVDTELENAEVYEFAWPAELQAAHDRASLANDLALQVVEAMVADIVEVAVTEADETAQAAEDVTFDVFGIASRPGVEALAAGAVPEDRLDEVETDPPAHVSPASEPALHEPVLAELTVVDDIETGTTDFDTAVADALAAGASAFHFSPGGDRLRVRARVDGLMRDLGTATPDERDALVDRLLAEGIARTHVVATSRGPKTTLFMRERAGVPNSLDGLGLGSDTSTALRASLETPNGAVLVCGPAGSGTTTTLYALLDALATPQRVVATVEHPIERLLDGVDQIEASPSQGVTFAGALHDLRLTDTDAVLVGDLPDRESAVGALSAAYEGRLVLAGFHARSAADAVRRLAAMGVEPAVLASSLGCVVSQRLVRTVCVDCREPYYASEDELRVLGQTASGSPRLLVRGAGCERCAGTGFRGRVAIFEVMPVTDDVRDLVAGGASAKKLQKAAVAAGMRTLRDEGVRLCLDGVTTVAEVVRVLGDDA